MRLLFLLFFFVISTTQHVTMHAVDDLLLIPPTLSCPSFPKRNNIEEGFDSSTLVLANCGYKRIGEFTLSDHIVDDCFQQIETLAIQRGIAKKYVKIKIENTTICVGCKQQFYVFPDCVWSESENLEIGAQLLGSCGECHRVHSVEIIDEPIVLSALMVEGQVFFVTPYNLLVHNMDAMTLGASNFSLEYITIVNPVVALLGAGVALSTVAYQAYNEYTQQQSIDISDNMEVSLPSKVHLVERYYYERRKADLNKLKNELINVKQGLETIKNLNGLNSTSFTHNFLQQQMQQVTEVKCCALSASNELRLSEKSRLELRKIREEELKALEQDIVNIQLVLALHVNELIVQIDEAFEGYDKASKEISVAINLWNSQAKYNNVMKTVALRSYENNLLEEYLVSIIDQRVTELKCVTEYYTSCVNSVCIKESTNIVSTLSELKSKIFEYGKFVRKSKERTCNNIANIECYLNVRGIRFLDLKNKIKNFFAQKQKETHSKSIENAKNKHARLSTPGGPKKDDDEEDEKKQSKITVHNMQSYFEKTQFGRTIRDSVQKTKKVVKGQPVYKVIKGINEYLKKGDQFYLDSKHKDHLEVFGKNNEFKRVIDLAGKEILRKTKQAFGRVLR